VLFSTSNTLNSVQLLKELLPADILSSTAILDTLGWRKEYCQQQTKLACVRVCQMLSTAIGINLFRYDDSRKIVYIIAVDNENNCST